MIHKIAHGKCGSELPNDIMSKLVSRWRLCSAVATLSLVSVFLTSVQPKQFFVSLPFNIHSEAFGNSAPILEVQIRNDSKIIVSVFSAPKNALKFFPEKSSTFKPQLNPPQQSARQKYLSNAAFLRYQHDLY